MLSLADVIRDYRWAAVGGGKVRNERGTLGLSRHYGAHDQLGFSQTTIRGSLTVRVQY